MHHTAGNAADAAAWFVVAQPLLACILTRASNGEAPELLELELEVAAAEPSNAAVRRIALDCPPLEAPCPPPPGNPRALLDDALELTRAGLDARDPNQLRHAMRLRTAAAAAMTDEQLLAYTATTFPSFLEAAEGLA